MTLAIRDREHLASSLLLLLACLSLTGLHAPCPLLELSACVSAHPAGFGLGLGVGILVLRLGCGEGRESIWVEWTRRLLSDLISSLFPLLLCPLRFYLLLLLLGHFLQFGLVPLYDAIVSLLSWAAAVLGARVRLTHATGLIETCFRLRPSDNVNRALPCLLMQFLRRCRGRARELHDVLLSHFLLNNSCYSFCTASTSCWLL